MRFRYQIVLGTLLLVLIGFMGQVGFAQTQSPKSQQPTNILFENVRIFDGISDRRVFVEILLELLSGHDESICSSSFYL
jgi:hypothetical protein